MGTSPVPLVCNARSAGVAGPSVADLARPWSADWLRAGSEGSFIHITVVASASGECVCGWQRDRTLARPACCTLSAAARYDWKQRPEPGWRVEARAA